MGMSYGAGRIVEPIGKEPVGRGIYFMLHLSVCHSFAASDHGLIPTEGARDLSPLSGKALLGQCRGCCCSFLLTDHWPLILGGLSLGATDILSWIIVC